MWVLAKFSKLLKHLIQGVLSTKRKRKNHFFLIIFFLVRESTHMEMVKTLNFRIELSIFCLFGNPNVINK